MINNLKKIRIAKRIKVNEVAEPLGMTPTNYYKYENGVVRNIPINKLLRIAQILGVNPAELFVLEPEEDVNKIDTPWMN